MNGLVITFFDVLALFYLFKASLGLINNKRICALMTGILTLVLGFLYYYFGSNNLGIEFHQSVLLIYAVVIIESLLYTIFKKGNLKWITAVLCILLLGSVIKVYLELNAWSLLLFIIPLIFDLLALDCSDMKNYTIPNVAAALFYILATAFMGKAFPIITSILYFLCSIFAYVKFNKLSVLNEHKEKKEQKRAEKLKKIQESANNKEK